MSNSLDIELLQIFIPKLENLLAENQIQWDSVQISLTFVGSGFSNIITIYFNETQEILDSSIFTFLREDVIVILSKRNSEKKNSLIIKISKEPKEYQIFWETNATGSYYQKRLDSIKKSNK